MVNPQRAPILNKYTGRRITLFRNNVSVLFTFINVYYSMTPFTETYALFAWKCTCTKKVQDLNV